MKAEDLKPNKIVRGPIFPEPVQLIVCIPMGDAVKLIGKGVNTSRVYEPILTPDQLAALETTPDTEPFDGDPLRFRLGVEAMRLAEIHDNDRLEAGTAELQWENDGRVFKGVETGKHGFDQVCHRAHSDHPNAAMEARFIQVKGRSHIGGIALTSNECNPARLLRQDYWLYVVFHRAKVFRLPAGQPEEAGCEPCFNLLNDPATLKWQPVVKVEHYRLRQDSVNHPVELKEDSTPYRTVGAA